VRDHLEQRLALAEQPALALWEQLIHHGREARDQDLGQIDLRVSDRLIEAIASQILAGQSDGDSILDRALETLDDPAAGDDWRAIFAVQLLGKARCDRAIDRLLQELLIDADFLLECANDALVEIGSVEVVEKIAAFYPGKAWDVRIYAHAPLSRIKRPQSEDALLQLIQAEDDDDELRCFILQDLCELGSLRALEHARPMVQVFPNNPEVIHLAEALLANAVMNGQSFDEMPAWRRMIDAHRARPLPRTMGEIVKALAERQDAWRRTGNPFAWANDRHPGNEKSGDATGWHPPMMPSTEHPAARGELDVQTYRRAAPKVGRNDPCPCGSGKKYKKCCWKSET
jgi:hypothetical protein